jgi:hypothetical protein
VADFEALFGKAMDRTKLEHWADSYIAAQTNPGVVDEKHPLWWTVEKFISPSEENSEECWAGILEVLSRKPPQTVIGMLAAGPLEDLIDCHAPAFIDRIELEARKNPSFRYLLGGVWESGKPEMWSRILRARGAAW